MNSLREALDDSPENLPLRLIYARRSEDALAWSEAFAIYEAILEKFPAHPSAALGIARTLFFQGKISEAEVRAEAVVTGHPRFAEGHLFLCRILCSDDDADLVRAAAHYRIALSIDGRLAEPALDRDLGRLMRRAEAAEGETHRVVTFGAEPELDGGFGDDDWLSSSRETPLDSPFELFETGEDVKNSEPGYIDGGFIDALKFGLDQNGMKVTDFDQPTINFNDVGGMESLKEDLRMKIVHPIKNPQLFKAYGIQPGGSLLLYGPPGCGKSMVCGALAGEVNASFYTVGLHQLLDAGVGRAEKQLHEIFHIAKMNAPSVLFLDEVDAIAGWRGMGEQVRSSLVNQLLKELDDVAKFADGVLVIAATSAPWLLDPAFHRAGRFSRRVCVMPPNELDRADIIRVLRNRIPVTDLDVSKIVESTVGFSGAELTAIFENAAERAIAESIRVGCYQPLTTDAIVEEAERLQPEGGQWFDIARKQVEGAQVAGSFRDLFRLVE